MPPPGPWAPGPQWVGIDPVYLRIPGGYGATDSEKSLQEAKWFLSGLDAASNPNIFQTIWPKGDNQPEKKDAASTILSESCGRGD